MKTNYSSISIKNFEKTVREYASFVVKLGKANLSNTAPKMQKINKNLNISNWKYFELGALFKIKSTKGNNTNNLIGGGDVAYIAAKKNQMDTNLCGRLMTIKNTLIVFFYTT